MTSATQQLKDVMLKISNLDHLRAILQWDEAVMMPSGGAEDRAKALSTLSSMIHEHQTSPEIADLIPLAKEEKQADPWDIENINLIEKNYLRNINVPSNLVERFTHARMNSEHAWRQMRHDNNWTDFKPLFSKTFSLLREMSAIQGESLGLSAYDSLIDHYSPGFNQSVIDPIFDSLKTTLPDRIQRITEKQKKDPANEINGHYPVEKQRELGLKLMQALGFNFNHGRLDVSHHPFCGGVPSDVRITTRYNEKEFITAAMGICHETGHARYEQGLPIEWRAQPVGKGLGMAIHESQSLIVEMYACRSETFMHFLSPLVKEYFGDHRQYDVENLYKIYTRVKPGFIRVDADEVTYPLHVILRYNLEQQLFNDQLTIDDLPDAWNAAMEKYFNLTSGNNHKNGVMQDVHWPAGIFGYFPAYTIGSLTAAQLFATAKKEHPQLESLLQKGDFSLLFAWLNKHIHSRASSVSADVLIEQATGSKLDPNFYLSHVDKRYQLTT